MRKKLKAPKIRKIVKPVESDYTKIIFVRVESHTIYHKVAEEQYGSWRTEEDNRIVQVTKKKPRTWDFYDKKVSDEVYNAEKVYIVAVTYSSGDIFGHCSGKLDIYKIFKDKESADLLADKIIKEKKEFVPETDEDWPSWIGYFETIDNVEVLKFEYE